MRLIPASWLRRGWLIGSRPLQSYSTSTRSPRQFEPLQILFCGSDDFSAAALRKLHECSQENANFIKSIDVVCKQGKLAGRGMTTVRDVEIKKVAEELSLPLYEIPTFTGWSPPASADGSFVNLILAVSFGLLVPPRLLDMTKYGGLNLHPSLLPDLRGPAPLHHALLQGRQMSGITLQTLHPKHFDRGIVLAQEQYQLPKDGLCNMQELRADIAPVAAKFLIQSLKQGVFVPPIEEERLPGVEESHAPKLTAEDAHVDWRSWSAERVLCTQSALGSLWSRYNYTDRTTGEQRSIRVQFHDLHIAETRPLVPFSAEPPTIATWRSTVYILTIDMVILSLGGMTIEGRKKALDAASESAFLQKSYPGGSFE